MKNRALLCLVLFCACSLVLAASPVAMLGDLAVLEDRGGTETIDSIAGRSSTDFRPLPGNVFAGGYTRSALWFRFTVHAPAGEWWLELLPPLLDDVRLYVASPEIPGGFVERRSGDMLPFAERELDYRS